MEFKKAVKEQLKARIALIGPSGSGKTYTALKLAKGLGKRIALLDTENASASKYVGDPGMPDFDTLALTSFAPQTYIKAIEAAEKAGYDVLIIDGLSHAWMGKEGTLQQVDKASVRYSGNKFAAWRDVTPHHNALVDALVWCSCHLIVTMRSKTHYDVQKDDDGKMKPVKIGMAPIQREGLEYEFDIVGDLDLDHNYIISKTRCSALDGAIIERPDEELTKTISAWLNEGTPPTPRPKTPPPTSVSAGSPTSTAPSAPQIPEGGFPHWGKVFEAVWDQFRVDRTHIMVLFPGKSQEDILKEHGTLEEVFHAICDKIAIAKAGGEFAKPSPNHRLPTKEGLPPARPFDALNLLVWLKAKAAEFDPTWEKREGLPGAVIGIMDKMCGGTEKRHAFLEAVFGEPSSKARSFEEMWAVWKWLSCEKDPDTGDWIPDQMAIQEARAIVEVARPRSAQKDIGELFPD